ncbi:MAG: hypothetical protein E6Q06_04620 [Candidatus Moraniibacteriota bacterium]|nr:MAG: hypothetical protein E6Q06_04620 [Candidatus Moranbacteria bacterium]
MENWDLGYESGDLFKWDREISDFNACVGTNGGPYTYTDYSRGYFFAARTVAEDVLQRRRNIDISIYPIFYLYRHAVELALKGMINFLSYYYNHEDARAAGHDILKLWNETKKLVKKIDLLKEDKELITFLEKVFQDISRLDESAEVFRFPESKGRELYLQDQSHINILVLYQIMLKVENVFEYWFTYKFELLLRDNNNTKTA